MLRAVIVGANWLVTPRAKPMGVVFGLMKTVPTDYIYFLDFSSLNIMNYRQDIMENIRRFGSVDSKLASYGMPFL